jgi:hypothetical protein
MTAGPSGRGIGDRPSIRSLPLSAQKRIGHMDDFCVGHMDDFVRPPRTLKAWVDHRNHKDAATELARDLADIAAQLASLKGEANSWLRDPDYDALKLRREIAHSAVEAAVVEARRRVRLNEGR